MNSSEKLERELIQLGLLDKTKEIYRELGVQSALSFIKSSHHLLSKVYHPDLNPSNQRKAKEVQQQLNHINELISAVSQSDFEKILRRGQKKVKNGKRKILIVEDEFGLQETFRDVFMMEGYDVRSAVDGTEGLEIFQKFHPDLIFTDVVMPKMNGLELVKKAREIEPEIKVIYISGFFGIKRLKRDLDHDILRYKYRYLSKPFKISEMLDMVDDYLGNNVQGINIVA